MLQKLIYLPLFLSIIYQWHKINTSYTMTQLLYLKDSYLKQISAKVIKLAKKGNRWQLILDRTIFYAPESGQAVDAGEIIGTHGKFWVENVRMEQSQVVHIGKLEKEIKIGEKVMLHLDWERRFRHMQLHSASHVIHSIIMKLVPGVSLVQTQHGQSNWIKYQGFINPKLAQTIETQSNMLIAEDRKIFTRFVTLAELKERTSTIPAYLPENKPLRIVQIAGFPPVPDSGTHVKSTAEIGNITKIEIATTKDASTVYYQVSKLAITPKSQPLDNNKLTIKLAMNLKNFQALLLELEKEILSQIEQAKQAELELLRVKYFGSSGEATKIIKQLTDLPLADRKKAGLLVNVFKNTINEAFNRKSASLSTRTLDWFDVTLPGIRPPQGHLHIVTQAIREITRIFERIGFTRVRHPEVDWDWYAFEALNMPQNHPARDEWETFFIDSPYVSSQSTPGVKQLHTSGNSVPTKTQIVLTPHTSNGQVREMEKGKLPIRMINIAKCYRRQSDVSHTPMFHQFEGMYIDKNVSIAHLKGVFDYFVKQFYGPKREIRLRPFHFQFTEPSFEVDITCDICAGTGQVSGRKCRLCKAGWLEMAGAGMIHPIVLRNGGIDPQKYSGFAFGWGVERAYMMKAGIKIDDLRIIYNNDVRFLQQF